MKKKRDWRALQPFLEAALILSIVYAEWIVTWLQSDSNFYPWSIALITTFFAFCFAFEGLHYIVNRKNVKKGWYLVIGAICMMIAFCSLFKGVQLSGGSMLISFLGFFQLGAICLISGTASFWKKFIQ